VTGSLLRPWFKPGEIRRGSGSALDPFQQSMGTRCQQLLPEAGELAKQLLLQTTKLCVFALRVAYSLFGVGHGCLMIELGTGMRMESKVVR
tara:strand:+ start:461 stop:733 length:273 start_codon:yes stop_codon:yes gene_type:complete